VILVVRQPVRHCPAAKLVEFDARSAVSPRIIGRRKHVAEADPTEGAQSAGEPKIGRDAIVH